MLADSVHAETRSSLHAINCAQQKTVGYTLQLLLYRCQRVEHVLLSNCKIYALLSAKTTALLIRSYSFW